MDIKDFFEIVVSKKNKSITDEIFLLIQNDKELMQKYLLLVNEKGTATVNRQIGKMIMNRYNLTPDDNRDYDPISSLILSYQEFK